MAERKDIKHITVRDVPLAATHKELVEFLGLNLDVGCIAVAADNPTTKAYRIRVNSMDEAMGVLINRNFELLRGHAINIELFPACFNQMFEQPIRMKAEVPLRDIFLYFKRFGSVVGVSRRSGPPMTFNYVAHFYRKQDVVKAREFFSRGTQGRNYSGNGLAHEMVISGQPFETKTGKKLPSFPDFWTPPPAPKGNLIAVPTNLASASSTDAGVAHIAKPVFTVPGVSSAATSAAATSSSTLNAPSPRTLNKSSVAQQQRASSFFYKVPPVHVQHPGEITGTPFLRTTESRETWCLGAFMCYESFYNMSSKSSIGQLAISSLAWGAQLDVASARLHYGSVFRRNGTTKQSNVVSSTTVQMRTYGEKESAMEVLDIRNRGHLPDTTSAMKEGINVPSKGQILSMKCLESGHLVTSSEAAGLSVYDLRDTAEVAKTTVLTLQMEQRQKFRFDTRGMAICSVDDFGNVSNWDLTKAVNTAHQKASSAANSPKPSGLACLDTTCIDIENRFYSSGISIHPQDSTVLVSSGEHGQVARWDFRTPAVAATTSLSCRRPGNEWKVQLKDRKAYDPMYNVEWNPNNPHEFMTVHPGSVRLWDERKMDSDALAILYDVGTVLRKAHWSPHFSDTIAGLRIDGRVQIWSVNSAATLAGPSGKQHQPTHLMTHRGHDLIVSDFAWCPHSEGLLSTVAPATQEEAGNIQVWRPRNLHDNLDEP